MDDAVACPSDTGTPGGVSLTDVVRGELAAVQKTRADLMVPWEPHGIHIATLVFCVLINLGFFLLRPDYFGLFIAASFYLNMYYFILLVIPTNVDRTSLKKADLLRLQAWFREMGITSGTGQFTRLFTNTLFMNSRALSLGIGLIFTIDSLFSLILCFQGLPLRTTAIVIIQCSCIVIFYLLVWKMEPFSSEYAKKIERAKLNLHRKSLPPQLIAGLLIFGFLIAIFLFLTTVIFLPGVTLNAFLDQSELTGIGHLFSLLAVLAISQYFLIRYIHGITSRTMAERVFDFKENSLQGILETAAKAPPAGGADAARYRREISALLLESKIFIVKRKTISGSFPVFVVDLDFSVMMDSTTLTAIKGYIVENSTGPG